MISKIPKVSVIIPVYNAEKYLRRCLDSVFNQTLKEIEVICVDDFSTDSSAEILQEYSKNYQNLTVKKLEKNQGESVARNTGLLIAKGEYLAFIDNDDEIDLDFYEKLFNKSKENNSDIIKGQAIEIEYNGKRHIIKQLKKDNSKFTFLTYWWTAIYKRSLIIDNKIKFSENHSLGGDLLFLNNSLIRAQDLEIVDETYYYYHRREDSGDSKILSEEKIKSALNIFETIINNTNSNIESDNSVYNFIFHHFIMSCFYLSLKSENNEVKKICAKATIDIFEKCQDKKGLYNYFSNTAPYLFLILQDKNIAEVENLLIKCKSRMELVASGLRARINRK